MMTLKTEPENLYHSSVFYMTHLAHEYNTRQLAELFNVSQTAFEDVLKEMGYDEDEIMRLRERRPFPPGFCRNCGLMLVEGRFCNNNCRTQFAINDEHLRDCVSTGHFPVTLYNKTYLDIETGEIVHDVKSK